MVVSKKFFISTGLEVIPEKRKKLIFKIFCKNTKKSSDASLQRPIFEKKLIFLKKLELFGCSKK